MSTSDATSSDDVDSDAGCSFNFPPREPEKNVGDEAQQGKKPGYTEQLYLESGYSKKMLVLFSHGLIRPGTDKPLIDLTEPPWSNEAKMSYKPSNQELVKEVERRQALFTGTTQYASCKGMMMRPKHKKREELMAWLCQFPIINPICKMFLVQEADRVATILEKAQKEDADIAEAERTGAWYGMVPYLRLVHCITDCDTTRMAYLRRNDAMERAELDAQGSANAPKTAYDIIAEKWNDNSFNPVTRVSSCRAIFRSSALLSHSIVQYMTPADALKVKNILSQIRANLLRMIQNWEQSGQGDGGRQNEGAEEGIVLPTGSYGWGTLMEGPRRR